MSEIVLPLRVVSQPIPQLNAGGDCGACVLGGLLGLSVADIYTRFQTGSKVEAFSSNEIHTALWRAQTEGLIDRLIDDMPMWSSRPPSTLTWGWPAWSMNLAWFRYVRMAMDAGYYALAAVVFDRTGPYYDKDGQRWFSTPDHYVMLVGACERREPIGGGGAMIVPEILVSCSSTKTPDEEWVGVTEFLRDRGGYNVMLARPARGAVR